MYREKRLCLQGGERTNFDEFHSHYFTFAQYCTTSILKALANEDTLLRTHCCRHKCFPVCPHAQHLLRTQILCPGHKNVSDFVQKHFVSATNVSQFAQPKKHHGQQCVRNKVSSFARVFKMGPLWDIGKRSVRYSLQDKGDSAYSGTQTYPKRYCQQRKALSVLVCIFNAKFFSAFVIVIVKGAQSRYSELFWASTKLPLNWRKPENNTIQR